MTEANWATVPDDHVRAAGGVIWRMDDEGGELEILLIHRNRYDDWTLPKGKLDPGEAWLTAAVREVWEETGYVPVVEGALGQVVYEDNKGRPKTVRYWVMTVAADSGFEAGEEVALREWVVLSEARDRVTYQRDQAVLDAFAATR